MKTEWNLKLLYKGIDDPQIELDVKKYEAFCAKFEKKYRDGKFLKSDTALLAALRDYEFFYENTYSSKPMRYLGFRTDLNSEDQKADAKSNLLSQRLTKSGNKLIAFDLALGKVDVKKQQYFLKSKKLARYTYLLKRLFDSAKHWLTEPEEKILSQKSIVCHDLWVQGQEKLLTIQTIQFEGEELPISKAQNMVRQLPTEKRRALSALINSKLKSISYFAESELNALYINKKIGDELRGYKFPFSKTVQSHQTGEKTVLHLVNTVTKQFSISHDFYRVKAKLLKLDSLQYADRAASAGGLKRTFTFEQSVEIFRKALEKVDPQFVSIFDSYLEKGQIDVLPKKGKRGGAYCAGDVNLPTYVLLNHTNDFDALKTLAHEMGHAFHTELSKSQPTIYQSYSTAVAEVASTFFENIAFEEVFNTLTPQEQIIALHDRINDSIATIFRQIACFNFELDLHTSIRTQGSLSKEAIAEKHNKHMKSYLGPVVNMAPDDGYFYVSWPHLRHFFYVYSYAFGELISQSLYANYKKDPAYIEKIKDFLSAGGSKTPEQIFKASGIDISKSGFFEAGLKQIKADIRKLDGLVKNML